MESVNIVPIPKGADAAQCSNPISLLPLVSKILERIVHNHLLDFLLKHKRLSPLQFGFCPKSSTQEALLCLTHDLFPQLDRGNHVAAVFFDLSKAFDSVPHHLLLAALQVNGIEGPILCWFQNYLFGRCQRVVLDGCASDPRPVTSGVPQGSIVGPLLFNIFMNSIFNIPLSHGSKIMVYADDIVLFKPITTDLDLTTFQNDIVSVDSWAKANSLKLNVTKTKVITFRVNTTHPPFVSV